MSKIIKRLFWKNCRRKEVQNSKWQAFESHQKITELAKNHIENEEKHEQMLILDYLISSLLDDACTSISTVYLTEKPNGILPMPFPNFYYDETGCCHSIGTNEKIHVDLKQSRIYVRPWDFTRTINVLKHLHENKFEFHEGTHDSYFYTDVNLCYVHGGNHSVHVGKYLKQGEIVSDVYDMRLLYEHITTDGRYWYNSHSQEPVMDVYDYRMAAVYSLARMRFYVSQK